MSEERIALPNTFQSSAGDSPGSRKFFPTGPSPQILQASAIDIINQSVEAYGQKYRSKTIDMRQGKKTHDIDAKLFETEPSSTFACMKDCKICFVQINKNLTDMQIRKQ